MAKAQMGHQHYVLVTCYLGVLSTLQLAIRFALAYAAFAGDTF